MEKTYKPFMRIDEQIRQLKRRGLLFESENEARKNLIRYGYYEIINGYKRSFMLDPNDDERGFINGVTFEHIFALFRFDLSLRKEVMASLEDFESNLKQVLAYVIAERISDNQNEYLDIRFFRSGKKLGGEYPSKKLFRAIKRALKSDTQPIKYYRENHENIPPWILVKGLTFGNIVWWFRLMKGPNKRLIVARMLGIPLSAVTEQIMEIVGNLVQLYLMYRNNAAHGGRVYSFAPASFELPYFKQLHGHFGISPADYRRGKGHNQFGIMLNSLRIFENDSIYSSLYESSTNCLLDYLNIYPQDAAFLLTNMQLESPLT